MKHIPIALIRELIEAALNQPSPTPELQGALQPVLKCGEHKDRLT